MKKYCYRKWSPNGTNFLTATSTNNFHYGEIDPKIILSPREL